MEVADGVGAEARSVRLLFIDEPPEPLVAGGAMNAFAASWRDDQPPAHFHQADGVGHRAM